VVEINSSTNSICPKTSSKSSLIEHTPSPLNNNAIKNFGKFILLGYMRSCLLIVNTTVREEGIESMGFILFISICSKNLYKNTCVQFNHRFSFTKVNKGLSFSIKKVNPDIVYIVICKSDVIPIAMI